MPGAYEISQFVKSEIWLGGRQAGRQAGKQGNRVPMNRPSSVPSYLMWQWRVISNIPHRQSRLQEMPPLDNGRKWLDNGRQDSYNLCS